MKLDELMYLLWSIYEDSPSRIIEENLKEQLG